LLAGREPKGIGLFWSIAPAASVGQTEWIEGIPDHLGSLRMNSVRAESMVNSFALENAAGKKALKHGKNGGRVRDWNEKEARRHGE